MRSNRYYKRLDLIRVVSCFAILLYHIGILKGGYLAVCTFFVLSGYLAVISSFRKEKFSIKNYYLSRLKKIYLPLLIVVFISIDVVSILNIDLINLKPEVTSILLGYNNYWQLAANLDYFVRYVSSPFMHLWYISILIQFEIVFPVVFIILKKIGKKISKIIPCLILFTLGLGSYLLFLKTVNDNNIMIAYYGTFNRLFSLLFGLLLGFIHVYYHPGVIKNKLLNKVIFATYSVVLIFMFFKVSADSKFFAYGMIITTLISMRLIDYAICNIKMKNTFDKLISSLSNISYEVYLVQYPVIFFYQNVSLNDYVKIFLIIITTFIIAYILNRCINIKTKDKLKVLKIIMLIPIVLATIYGAYKYVIAKDYTKQMKKLEETLNKNKELIKQKQKEYSALKQDEKDEWEAILSDLDNSEKKIKEMVENLNIVGVGDSIMAGTVNDLYEQFPNGYFDGKVNRTEYQTIEVLEDLKNKGILSDVILFNIGTNGDCNEACKDKLMAAVGDRKVFWVNATNPDYDTFNAGLEKVAKKYSNIHIVDWISVAKDHPEYLYKDKVHPTQEGSKIYVQTVYNAIYNEYLEEFKEKKDKMIKEHEEKEKSKITFIGNDLLLGAYEYILKDYSKSEFVIDKDFNTKSLIKTIKNKINNKTLNYNIVLIFDSKVKLTKAEYQELINLCSEYKIYVVDIDNSVKINDENINVINFYKEIKKNKNYTKFDGTHLTEEGNLALTKTINSYLK